MAARRRTEAEWISFLLTCMDNTPAKPDWNKIALDTGAYKSGKFVLQAYNGLRTKYGVFPTIGNEDDVPADPRSKICNKRASATALDEGDRKAKRERKAKKVTKKDESSDDQDQGELGVDGTGKGNQNQTGKVVEHGESEAED